MRIAIAGKGGVGKTTLSAFISWTLKDMGSRVVAVDADPDTNLGFMLGFPGFAQLVPIIRMKKLIRERMGVTEENPKMFKLNPHIDDIPEKFAREHNGIKLIVMGTIKAGASGCACPENTFLKRLLHKIVLGEDEHIVVDFEAGVEHLGRGTASQFDHLIIVVEPTRLSLDSFKRIYPLAKDIGIKKTWIAANRVKSGADIDFVKSQIKESGHSEAVSFLGAISYSDACANLNKTGDWQALKKEAMYKEVRGLVDTLIGQKHG